MVYRDFMTTGDETPRSTEPDESRLEFETLISDLSSRFINLSPGEVDGEIEESLHRVCELLGLDLAVLWQWSADVIAPTHAYPTLGGLQPPEPLHQEQFPWLRQQILAGRLVALSSLEEFPAEAVVDREYCRHYGVKSHLSLPLLVGGEPPVGLLGFNTLQTERDWPDSLVKRLQLVAQVFANALARKRVDEALRESEERLAMAADSAAAGLWILDYGTGDFWVTERTRAIFGYSPDEVVDVERFMSMVHPDDRVLVREAMEQAGRATEPVVVEYRVLTGDGRERWVVSRGRSQVTPAGQPERLMGVSIDISGRKRAQEAVRASEARLEAGAELAGLAFYEVDFVAGTMYSDDRLRDLCGVPPEVQGIEVLQIWVEHLHPTDRARVLELRRQLHDGSLERFAVEYRYLHPGCGEQWIQHLAGVAAYDETGHAARTYGVLRDVTGRKRAEEDLHDLSRRLIGAHEDERALLRASCTTT
jgi:PAS domain S-box-containing protein